MTYQVLLYYHFRKIENTKEFAQQHLAFCNAIGLKGRILVAPQGLNGTCAGTKEQIEQYKTFVQKIPGFKKIWFKEHSVNKNPFFHMYVRPKPEMVAFDNVKLNFENSGEHISPTRLNKLYEKHKDDENLVIIDMRNDIEYQVGHFEGAINPKVDHFRDLPKMMKQFENAKDKTVVMYCTGGIRCELATPYFKDKGFKKVYQLNGGIYNYCDKFPNGKFKGDCFVFDDRMSIRFTKDGVKTWEKTPQDKIVSTCKFCKGTCNRVVNDEEKRGRKLIVCCEGCDTKLDISRERSHDEFKKIVAKS